MLKTKLNTKKKLDFIIANRVKGDKSAIGANKAEVHLLNKWDEKEYRFNYDDKERIASLVIDKMIELIKKNFLNF